MESKYIEGKPRRNPNWKNIQPGDPVISDFIVRRTPKGLAFIPFTFEPHANEPDRTKCPLGGSLVADLCFPYGELTDLLYEAPASQV